MPRVRRPLRVVLTPAVLPLAPLRAPAPRMVPLRVRVPAEVAERLRTAARGRPLAEVVREVLEGWLGGDGRAE